MHKIINPTTQKREINKREGFVWEAWASFVLFCVVSLGCAIFPFFFINGKRVFFSFLFEYWIREKKLRKRRWAIFV